MFPVFHVLCISNTTLFDGILLSVGPAPLLQMVQVSSQNGIRCRFGARGIIGESHYDHGQNFVLMLRGRKRYLLNPPHDCPHLAIIKDAKHPSYRHSDMDWSNESEWPEVCICVSTRVCVCDYFLTCILLEVRPWCVCMRVMFRWISICDTSRQVVELRK